MPVRDPDFPHRTFGSERRREIGTQNLNRDFAIVLDIVREVDSSHAAGPEFLLDGVAVSEC